MKARVHPLSSSRFLPPPHPVQTPGGASHYRAQAPREKAAQTNAPAQAAETHARVPPAATVPRAERHPFPFAPLKNHPHSSVHQRDSALLAPPVPANRISPQAMRIPQAQTSHPLYRQCRKAKPRDHFAPAQSAPAPSAFAQSPAPCGAVAQHPQPDAKTSPTPPAQPALPQPATLRRWTSPPLPIQPASPSQSCAARVPSAPAPAIKAPRCAHRPSPCPRPCPTHSLLRKNHRATLRRAQSRSRPIPAKSSPKRQQPN